MAIKEKIRQIYFTYLHDYIYSTGYYIKNIWEEIIGLVKAFKDPLTWTRIFIVVSVYAIVSKNYTMFKIAIPLVIVFGIIRQRKERGYKRNLIKNALLKNNDIILGDEYKKYTRNCFHSKKEALGFEPWKTVELDKLKNNNK